MINEVAALFPAVTLDELGDARLMDRVDRKYVIPRSEISGMLRACVGSYRILEVRGVRLNRYSTRYFDTPDLAFYHAHHADRAPRTKVRMREYLDSGVRFMELKRRTNKARTFKSRVAVSEDTPDPIGVLTTLPDFSEFGVKTDAELIPILDVRYTRITLVRVDSAERVTIDMDIEAERDGRVASFPNIVFAEVKQDRRAVSPFVDQVRAARITEGAISKYCLGVVSLVEGARKNRFKRRLHDLERAATHR